MSDRTADRRPTVALDFDGVIHAYSNGWNGGAIYDGAVPGFWAWAFRATPHARLAVFSTRSDRREGRAAMAEWIANTYAADTGRRAFIHPERPDAKALGAVVLVGEGGVEVRLEFPAAKPPAMVTIDDRAVQFRGDWEAPWLDPAKLAVFRPWNAI